jgi:uncharacterized membrane-anchored protein YhcB (DUF1043 family)
MISVEFSPVYLEVGAPALGLGLLAGMLIMWLIARRRRNQLLEDLEQANASLKNQEALQAEREAAFEIANAKLTQAFADISNRSLRANSDTFLQLASRSERRWKRLKSKSQTSRKPVARPMAASRVSLSPCTLVRNP